MNQPDGDNLTLDEVAFYLKARRFRRAELDRWIAAQIAEKAQDRT